MTVIKTLAVVLLTVLATVTIAMGLYYGRDRNRQPGGGAPPVEIPVMRTIDKQLGVVCYATPTAIACVKLGVEI